MSVRTDRWVYRIGDEGAELALSESQETPPIATCGPRPISGANKAAGRHTTA